MLPKKSTLAALACAVVVTGSTAGLVVAGEVNGKGEPTAAPANANSICAFSGQNDNPDRPLNVFNPGGRTQSFGQENKLGLQDPHVSNPGDACQGGSNFRRDK